MNGMSEREYSTHSGLSRGAVQNAKRGGRLVFYADGSINAAASDVRRAEMSDPDQQRRSLGGDAVLPRPKRNTRASARARSTSMPCLFWIAS